jgi:hypothetical protein
MPARPRATASVVGNSGGGTLAGSKIVGLYRRYRRRDASTDPYYDE